ncbi:MAG: hypothetical protein EA416_07045 [Trueperaceae bacterium]|nr:MAG: hypothetical protein EA416_07045 [Trueperaceae bacterium]
MLVVGVALSTAATSAAPGAQALPVSGTGVHSFSTAIIHSQVPTESGMIQRSSDIVTLQGDLEGHLLYHPTSTFDYEAGTLVNTGTQVFSGTVLGSDPVILHDDRFRFEVDLETGAMTGAVYLGRSNDTPAAATWFDCDLAIVGTGVTDDGDATFAYEGSCRRNGA